MNEHDAFEQAYKNGYEKGKADAAAEIFAEIEKCRVIGGRAIFGGQITCYLKDDIAELKKKFTESEKNDG